MKTALPNFLSRIFGLFVALLVGFLAVVVIEIIFGQVDQFAPPPLLKKVGDSDNQVLKRHVFRNAMLIIISGFPAAFISAFFTGSLLIETIFSLDGLGLLSFESIINIVYN